MPVSMPAIAPTLLMRFEKMPIISTGKIEDCREAEGQGHGLRREPRWIEAEPGGERDGEGHRDARGEQLPLLRYLRIERAR